MAKVRAAGILGVGSWAPPRVLTNHDLEKMVDTSDEWIVSRTGIRERRIADPDMATSDLAVEAARRALADAGVDAAELDLIVVATVTPDMFFPATACIVQDKLGAKTRRPTTCPPAAPDSSTPSIRHCTACAPAPMSGCSSSALTC